MVTSEAICTRGRMEQRQKTGDTRPLDSGTTGGVLSSFFNFFPLATCHPIFLAARRPVCRSRQACYPPGHRSPCLAADESLCDTSHKANRDPSTPVPRQSCGTPDVTLSLSPDLSSWDFPRDRSTAALKSRRLGECGGDLYGLRVESEWSE